MKDRNLHNFNVFLSIWKADLPEWASLDFSQAFEEYFGLSSSTLLRARNAESRSDESIKMAVQDAIKNWPESTPDASFDISCLFPNNYVIISAIKDDNRILVRAVDLNDENTVRIFELATIELGVAKFQANNHDFKRL